MQGMRRKGTSAAFATLALGLAGASGATHAALQCEQLASLTPEASTITSAALAGPGTVAGVNTTVQFCRVQGVARPSQDSEIKFEVWLPATAAAWTKGRFKQNGTGGFSGGTPYSRLAQDVGDGYVTAGSNMGHDGGENASWTLGHPEKVKDWGLRAHYYVATAAKALAVAFFDKPVAHSYFEGCSNGGRQAMMVAQNYPQLFDGIVAGAPSQFYPDVLFWLLWAGKALSPAPGTPAISLAKRQLVTQRVLQACDAIDGLADGQITNPRACNFNIDTLGPSGDNSLTAQELAAVKAMYAGTHNDATGEQRYSGAKLGSEAFFDPNFADNGGYGVFIGHYVYSDNTWTLANWRDRINFSDVYDHVKEVISPVTAAPSPDIREFVSHGGKLIQFAGWGDSVVPPDGSVAYFFALTQMEKMRHLPADVLDKQGEKLSPQVVAATAQAFGDRVREYHRLFMAPAVSHCGGGTGPNAIGGGFPEPPAAYRDADHHVVSAVMKWVEEGVAPDRIIATSFSGANLVRSRPLCAYPAQAAYNGSGDINDAANFSCVTPKLSERTVTSTDVLLIQNSLRQRDLKLPNR